MEKIEDILKDEIVLTVVEGHQRYLAVGMDSLESDYTWLRAEEIMQLNSNLFDDYLLCKLLETNISKPE